MSAPGRVRVALANLICGLGYSVFATRYLPRRTHEFDCRPENLWPNLGYWRTSRYADVQPWSGQVRVRTTYHHDGGAKVDVSDMPVASWYTMTDLAKGRLLDWDYDCGYELKVVYIDAEHCARTHIAWGSPGADR